MTKSRRASKIVNSSHRYTKKIAITVDTVYGIFFFCLIIFSQIMDFKTYVSDWLLLH